MQLQSESTERSTQEERQPGRELRWMADGYEQAQRVRVQTGERIRAVAQERDETWTAEAPVEVDADTLLQQIRTGRTDGPVPLLGRTYRRHWEAEQEMAQAMQRVLQQHPAWPWLSQVKGIGPTLAGKLLARLDATRAETPSAFWAYCGLGTVPGIEYRCATCGYTAAFPVSFRVSGTHQRLGGKRKCSGNLEVSRTEGVRVAQPKPARGQKAGYDQMAKKTCYLIGTSFLKAGGAYATYYRAEKARLESDRPGWAGARRHLAALRKTEKLFLSHLWLVWRAAIGLPLTEPYAHEEDTVIDPWEMVEGGPAAKGESPRAVGSAPRAGAEEPASAGAVLVPRSARRPAPVRRPSRSRETSHLRLET